VRWPHCAGTFSPVQIWVDAHISEDIATIALRVSGFVSQTRRKCFQIGQFIWDRPQTFG
jgi:hypothetical protein